MTDVIVYIDGNAIEVTKARLTNTSILYMIGGNVIEEPVSKVGRVYKDTTLEALTKEVNKNGNETTSKKD